MKKHILPMLILMLLPRMLAAETKVACIGDSITFGSKVENRAINSYPAVLQSLLGDDFEVKNFGNPGRGIIKTSKRGKGNRAYMFMNEHQQALAFEPDIVICNLGMNDIMDYPKKGNSEAFVMDYIELISAYRDQNPKVRVMLWHELGPLHEGQNHYGSPDLKGLNHSIGEVIKELNKQGRRGKMPDVESIDMNLPLIDRPELFPDYIHPNAEGARIIAEETYEKLKKLRWVK